MLQRSERSLEELLNTRLHFVNVFTGAVFVALLAIVEIEDMLMYCCACGSRRNIAFFCFRDITHQQGLLVKMK